MTVLNRRRWFSGPFPLVTAKSKCCLCLSQSHPSLSILIHKFEGKERKAKAASITYMA